MVPNLYFIYTYLIPIRYNVKNFQERAKSGFAKCSNKAIAPPYSYYRDTLEPCKRINKAASS